MNVHRRNRPRGRTSCLEYFFPICHVRPRFPSFFRSILSTIYERQREKRFPLVMVFPPVNGLISKFQTSSRRAVELLFVAACYRKFEFSPYKRIIDRSSLILIITFAIQLRYIIIVGIIINLISYEVLRKYRLYLYLRYIHLWEKAMFKRKCKL